MIGTVDLSTLILRQMNIFLKHPLDLIFEPILLRRGPAMPGEVLGGGKSPAEIRAAQAGFRVEAPLTLLGVPVRFPGGQIRRPHLLESVVQRSCHRRRRPSVAERRHQSLALCPHLRNGESKIPPGSESLRRGP